LELSFRFPATTDAPRLARQAVGAWLTERVEPERAHDARLLTSELVTNAVRHGGIPEGGVISLGVEASGSSVRIVVEQPTSAWPAEMRQPSADRGGGIGLHLVDRLADSWGVEHGVPGKVWFVVPARPLPARPSPGYGAS
jgi:anti-sigma regulatory factor (Ser/Thr protein kinase)